MESVLKPGDLVALKNTGGGFTDPGLGNWTISPGQVKPLPKRISPRIADLIRRGLLVASAPAVTAPVDVDPAPVVPPADPPVDPPVDPPAEEAPTQESEPSGKKKKKGWL